jgi:hypothetical protein
LIDKYENIHYKGNRERTFFPIAVGNADTFFNNQEQIMNNFNQTVAIELPSICPFNCSFCRTPKHSEGKPEAVLKAMEIQLQKKGTQYFYFTSNGETGLFEGFERIVGKLLAKGVQVGVLCASKLSVLEGLSHAEVSFNKYTLRTAEIAINKARAFNIPFAVSLVDDGDDAFLRYAFETAQKLGADAILTRAMQAEGLSEKNNGKTTIWTARNSRLPRQFPIKAYRELDGLQNGTKPICINPFGKIVEYLGSEPMSITA